MPKPLFHRKPMVGFTTDHVTQLYRDMNIRNSADWKRADNSVVDDWIAKYLPAGVEFKYPMRDHQKRAYCLGLINPKFYFQLDMGLGKSKVALDILLTKLRIGQATRALVLVPATLNLDQWKEQVEDHAPALQTLLCKKGTDRFAEDVRSTDHEVCVMTYGAAVSMHKKDPKFFSLFDYLILDESSTFRSHDSITFKTLKPVCKTMKSVYLLSGTPFSKSAMGLWSQFYLLDEGWLLGWNVTEFRRRFFIEKVTRWSTEWILHPDRESLLFRVLHHLSLRYKADECEDLPPELTRTIEVQASPQQRELFKELDNVKQELLAQDLSVGHLDHNLRLLSCGVHVAGDGYAVLTPNPKLDALLDLLDEIQEVMGDEQVIVVHHSVVLTDILVESMKEKKIKAVAVNGSMTPKEKDKAIEKFRTEKARVLVANSTAAYGLNLQSNCRIMIFFEHHEDMLVREQIKKRIHRMGQTRKVYYYDLTMDLGKDEDALATLTLRRNRLARTVDGHKAEPTRRGKRIRRGQ